MRAAPLLASGRSAYPAAPQVLAEYKGLPSLYTQTASLKRHLQVMI